MADWSLPTLTSLYTDVLTMLMNRDIDSATLGYGGVPTNPPTHFIRANGSTNRLERWDGTAFQSLFGGTWNINVSGNAATATTAGSAGVATNISAYTINQNLGTTSSPTFSQITATYSIVCDGDLYSYRSGGTTGVLFLNQSASRYIYNDSTSYIMPGQELYVNGSRVLSLNNMWNDTIAAKQDMIINKTNSTYSCNISGRTNNINRWVMSLADWSSAGESGSNLNSNFSLSRFSDAGVYLGSPIVINRQNGDIVIGGGSSTTIQTHILGNDRFEIGTLGSGDRNAYLDFHSSGASGSIDFSARIIRYPGVNGNLDLVTTGTGIVTVNSSPLVTGATLGMSKLYTTPTQTFTLGGAYSFTHGLGATPRLIQIEYECATAEGGFVAGDKILIAVAYYSYSNIQGPQPQKYDATTINFRMGNAIPVLGTSGGGLGFTTTPANWRWRAFVWA